MVLEKKVEFLQTSIDKQIEGFRKRRLVNRQESTRIHIWSTSLSAITTVLLGLTDIGSPALLKNVALCASSLVTLLNTWETFFNHKGMYIHYNHTVTELLHLRTDLDYLLCQGIDNVQESDLDAMYGRYQAILESTNSTWSDLRKQQSSSSSKN
jgi:hypothetical protein